MKVWEGIVQVVGGMTVDWGQKGMYCVQRAKVHWDGEVASHETYLLVGNNLAMGGMDRRPLEDEMQGYQ